MDASHQQDSINITGRTVGESGIQTLVYVVRKVIFQSCLILLEKVDQNVIEMIVVHLSLDKLKVMTVTSTRRTSISFCKKKQEDD